MPPLIRGWRVWLIGLAVAAAIGGGILLTRGTTPVASESTATLSAVDHTALSEAGIVLTTPTTQPAVTPADARSAALAQYPKSAIRATTLAVATNTQLVPKTTRLCWIVSIVPPGGIQLPGGAVNPGHPSSRAPLRATYFLVFIDANSGLFLYAESGGAPQ
jgi:hypothetical protein